MTHSGNHQRHGHVVEHRAVVQKAVVLKDHAHFPTVEGDLAPFQPGQVSTAHADLAPGTALK